MPVMTADSGAFWASGTFWAGAGTVAGVLGTAAVVWVTLTVGFPRRRLSYWLRVSAPLLAAPHGMRSDLELRRRARAVGESPGAPDGWQVLSDPRVVTIDLTSRGRRDIPSEAFNDRQPLQFDVGAPVVEVLQVTSGQADRPALPVIADGSLLSIGPGLIGKRQEITITVLTDGGEAALTCHGNPFIDVQVRRRPRESASTRVTAVPAFAVAVPAFAVAVVASAAVASAVAAVAGPVAAVAAVAGVAAVTAVTAMGVAMAVTTMLDALQGGRRTRR
jgi:hypothetical protein